MNTSGAGSLDRRSMDKLLSEGISVLEAAFAYVRQHPEEVIRVLRNAAGLRFGVPMAALRWLAGKASGKKAPKDVEISAVPPGIRVGGSFELMGTPLRALADVYIDSVTITAEELSFGVRLKNVSLRVTDDKVESPLAALLRSGALDLSKPGNLVAYMPKRPAILTEAKDDRIRIDLFRHPKLKSDPKLKRLLAAIVPLVTVGAIETEGDHLDVRLRAFPEGVSQAVERLRKLF
ncbi:MAG TPA: hypothetical protein VFQ61_30455 [Polyangiaceae bacterium]|nr:hypothetical protein [Polyangiaceae bacterium]